MSYKIGKSCVKCGACECVCAMTAITEKNGKYTIDKKKCTECNACKDVCPVECIRK